MIKFADEEKGIITKNKLVIIDTNKYNEAKKELLDIKGYAFTDGEHFEYLPDWITQFGSIDGTINELFKRSSYKTYYTCKINWSGTYIETYKNPRSQSLALLMHAKRKEYLQSLINFDLLELLRMSITQTNAINQQKEQIEAIQLIESISNSSLDSETIHYLISTLYPDFHFFATKLLNCIDFKPIEQEPCLLKELQEAKKAVERLGMKQNDLDKMLTNISLARNNSKVLKLAKDIK